ncbi:hypothetical protein EZ054_06935 [Enterococcus faecalis]|nr:hypothetical protein [Enterococcus faecalis]MUN82626.1 hypothetical protein [Enterococcus faecalis]TQA90486.1 hypothetical protein FKZ05_05150 [Enterococcus faecalis]
MFFNFWRISAYFRRSCFCSRRLLVFERRAKIQSDFCPTLFILWVKISYKKELGGYVQVLSKS